jgi:hypothetical protein
VRSEISGKRVAGLVVGGLVVVILMVLGFAALFGLKKVPVGFDGLSYGGGLVEANHFQGFHLGGSGLFENGLADHLYKYPTTQRNYIISLNPKEGDEKTSDSVTVQSSDSIPVQWQLAVYFKLNVNPEVLRQFHETLGLKYGAYWGSAHPGSPAPEGWDNLLRDSFRPQIQNALKVATAQFTSQRVYSDPQAFTAIQSAVGVDLKDNVNRALGGAYFCGVAFVPGKADCPDFTVTLQPPVLPPEVVASYQDIKVSQNQVQVEANKVLQADNQAKAIKTISDALKTAGPDYVLYTAVINGKVTFWVIPPNSGVTITRPGPG